MPTILIQTPSNTHVQNGVLQSLPNNGYFSFPAADAQFTYLTIQVNLALADKLAVGNTIDFKVFLSTDGTDATRAFVSGYVWVSYGPNGLPANPRFGIPANPDPTINFPTTIFIGNFIRLEYQFTGSITRAGATIIGNP